MPPEKKKIWFPAKKYGWSWGPPCAWQGWMVLVAHIAIISGLAFLLLPKHFLAWYGCIAASAAILLAICWVKGDKLRWRRGKD